MDPTENPQPQGVVDDIDPLASGDFVVTEEGVLTAEDYAARQAAGLGPEIVSEEALAEQALKSAESEVFDAPLLTFGERALGASTFGIADLFRGSESAYEARRRVEYNPLAATAGEIAGAVAPGLLSGGTGTLGVLARATPAGRLSAAAARTISRGGLGRVVGAGAVEGAVGSMGDYISRAALSENPSFSGEALLSSALGGAALGGALGGLGDVVGKGAGKAGRALEREPAGFERAIADVLGETPQPRRTILDTTGKPTALKKVVRRELAESNADAARALGARIDDVATRKPVRELDDFLASDAGAALARTPEGLELLDQARAIGRQLESASADTANMFRRYADEVDLARAKKVITKSAGERTEDELVALVAETDGLAARFDNVIEEAAARAGVPNPVARTVDPNLAKLNDDLAANPSLIGRARERLGGLGETASSVAGVAELAGAAGVDIPRPSQAIPVVGDLMGLYLKYKGARAALKGAGLMPATRTGQAAGKVVSLRDKISARVRDVASGTLKRVERATPLRVVPAQVASRIANIGSVSPEAAGREAYEQTRELGPEVAESAAAAAARAAAYLQETAPRDPLGMRPPTLPPWQPTQAQAMEWARRADAVADPEMAAARVLSDGLAAIEAETLRSVYPQLFRAMANDIVARAPEIIEAQGLDTLRRLARTFQLPLSVDTASQSYGTVVPPTTFAPANPMFTRPSTPGASPSVNLESTAPSSRPRG